MNRGSRRASEGRRQYWRLNWQFIYLPSGYRPWPTQHGFFAVSYLVLVSGQLYDRGDHCEQESDVHETGVAGVHSSLSCESDQQAVVSSSCLAPSAQPGSVMDVASLLVGLANPLHLPFRHIEDVCNFSRILGLEIFLMISTLVSGLILGMLTEAMLSINWWLSFIFLLL